METLRFQEPGSSIYIDVSRVTGGPYDRLGVFGRDFFPTHEISLSGSRNQYSNEQMRHSMATAWAARMSDVINAGGVVAIAHQNNGNLIGLAISEPVGPIDVAGRQGAREVACMALMDGTDHLRDALRAWTAGNGMELGRRNAEGKWERI